MTAPPEMLYDPPGLITYEEGDGGGDRPQLVIMTSILREDNDEMWSSRIATELTARPPTVVDALLSSIRGAAAAHSTLVHTVLADRLSAMNQPAIPGLTVGMLDQLASHGVQAHGAQPAAITVPGYPHPVPFDVARAVLVAAGAW